MKRMSNSGGISLPSAAYGVGVAGGGGVRKVPIWGRVGCVAASGGTGHLSKYMLRKGKGEQQEEMLDIYM